jgi:hypothetical protein
VTSTVGRVTVSRRDLLRRGAGLIVGVTVLGRLRWLENAYAATPNAVTQTLQALVEYVVPDRRVAMQRLIATLDRFLPGPVPLSSTAATILDAYAKQVAGKPFARLSGADKSRVFATVARLPVESAGSIQFLVGNLPDLTAFLAYSDRRAWRLSRYSGVSHGRKELKGYWKGRKGASPSA